MAKKQNVLLIQPHSDDIAFSASYYLFNRDKFKKVSILTVEADESRLGEDQKLCDEFDIELITLKTKVSSKGFHKKYYSERKKMDDDSALEFCEREIGKRKLQKLINEMETILNKYEKRLVVAPLGVGHPFHWLVSTISYPFSDIFYRDFPHSYKRRNQEYLKYVTTELFRHKFDFYDKELHDKKFEIIKRIYKSQSSLLFFEKRYIDKQLPEEFYEAK